MSLVSTSELLGYVAVRSLEGVELSQIAGGLYPSPREAARAAYRSGILDDDGLERPARAEGFFTARVRQSQSVGKGCSLVLLVLDEAEEHRVDLCPRCNEAGPAGAAHACLDLVELAQRRAARRAPAP